MPRPSGCSSSRAPGVLGVLALVMYARRVESVEVLAVLLFVPVFLALLRWNLVGGIVAAAVATVAYVALRASAIDAVGASRFTGLIVARAIGYGVFGALGRVGELATCAPR